MAKLAILGFGTVGSGIPEVLRTNAEKIYRRLGEELAVKYILDVRDFSQHPDAGLFVREIELILADPEVAVVAEAIGGLTPAFGYVCRALDAGKHVVTSNKELVAVHGAELLARAKQNGGCFLFEASVGGGMPLIAPLHENLAPNRITAVAGIVNGTTNFMLTMMERQGLEFDEALRQAQQLGYAETGDPSADVDGLDAGRKIAILSSLCFGRHIHPQDISLRGIRSITAQDMQAASSFGAAVRLIAWANADGQGSFACGVEPMLVSRENPLSAVDDVYNAVQAACDMLGRVQFYGRGAGRLPTAAAMVTDAIEALKIGVSLHDSLFWQAASPRGELWPDTGCYRYYLRVQSPEGAAGLLPGAQQADEGALLLDEPLAADAFSALRRQLEEKGCAVTQAMKWLD